MRRVGCALLFAILMGCSSAPKKPDVPPLNLTTAVELLNFDHKAKGWIDYVKKHDPTCEYTFALPDQASQPTEIDIDHAISCGGRPAPLEYNASVVFVFDKQQQRWIVERFSS